MSDYSAGQDMALDVTIVSPVQANNVYQASRIPGASCAKASVGKDRKYKVLCSAQNLSFLALSFEATGGMTAATNDLITDIANRVADKQIRPRSDARSLLFQQISISLQKYVGQSLVVRFQPSLQ